MKKGSVRVVLSEYDISVSNKKAIKYVQTVLGDSNFNPYNLEREHRVRQDATTLAEAKRAVKTIKVKKLIEQQNSLSANYQFKNCNVCNLMCYVTTTDFTQLAFRKITSIIFCIVIQPFQKVWYKPLQCLLNILYSLVHTN